MGKKFTARCNVCQTEFDVREGGGLNFYLLHCNSCGKEKELSTKEVEKALPDQNQTLSRNEKIEAIAGTCENGHYRLNAKARCPKCGSADYSIVTDKDGKVRIAFYD
ncbi:hypothetical protein Q5O24_03225 [Eubacteriaceae bacterium ES3]|nr:hypothetical protein Q5O24_03225 [Eubacteriaceae bacterium ES3]